MTAYYQKMFIRDTRDYLARLNPLLSRLESRTATGDDIDNAFRLMHSIKSEAAHLGKKSIADLAHVAESVLQELKEEPQYEGHLNRLFESVSRIEDTVSREGIASGDTPSSLHESGSSPAGRAEEKLAGFEVLNEFQLVLLREARDRGEYLYRMICEFEDPTEMLYPKAVLILNNLEQIVNVIRSFPDLSQGFEEENISPEYFFTTHRPEKDLFNAVKVDQVKRVFLTRLNWDQYLPDTTTRKSRDKAGKDDSQLIINRHELISIWFNYLKGKIHTQLTDQSIKGGSSGLTEVFDGIDQALQATRFVPFETIFHDLPEIVSHSAAEQGKDARCLLQGGEQLLESCFVPRLRGPLVQLLRNAVSHGIEEPAARLKEGKSPRGEVTVRYQRSDKEIRIDIQDDGRGMDEKAIRNKALEHGLDSSASLFRIITYPGFSTSEIISLEAGRGIGLDIVAEEIGRIPGATVSLENRENQGVRFCISIPVEASVRKIYFARYKRHTIAVDGTVFLEHEKPEKTGFRDDGDGRVRYRGCPVYTCEGYLFWSDNFVSEDTLIKIRNSREDYYLLVDKLLFSESFPADLFVLSEAEGGEPLSQLSIGGLKTGISFLSSDDLLNLKNPVMQNE